MFPADTSLMAGLARVHDGVGDVEAALLNYKRLLQYESTHPEVLQHAVLSLFPPNNLDSSTPVLFSFCFRLSFP
jgi:hypothetical protein